MNDAWPDGFWTYPPVALFSVTVKALEMLATATKNKNEAILAILLFTLVLFVKEVAPPLIPSVYLYTVQLNFAVYHPESLIFCRNSATSPELVKGPMLLAPGYGSVMYIDRASSTGPLLCMCSFVAIKTGFTSHSRAGCLLITGSLGMRVLSEEYPKSWVNKSCRACRWWCNGRNLEMRKLGECH